jgi:dipeptidase D
MTQELLQLEPTVVWEKFSALNAVPRPSKKEERVIDFMLEFGRSLQLETFRDEVGNVIIRKPATAGMAAKKTITLQSHLDMVHQKNADTEFDFETQGIQMFVDNDWVRAKGTTLGADNGMGVAAIMALLESKEIPHPALEALFTIDEETGMTGAKGLKGGVLQGDILLNLDTEEDDEIDIGCAGGIDVTARGSYKEVEIHGNVQGYQLSVTGLQGGHSGMDIHRGFGNANKIMNRLLHEAEHKGGLTIVSVQGGGLRNAIPRESSALFKVEKEKESVVYEAITKLADDIGKELALTEPKLTILLRKADVANKGMEKSAQEQFLQAVYAAHNGVFGMSPAIEGLVETSNNVARVKVLHGDIKIGCLTRSSVDSAKKDLANSLSAVFKLVGYEVTLSGDYPGWNPNPDSEILEILKKQYEELFNEVPDVVACHAGLECGILGQNYPDLDMISFGPTIKGAHSPDERVHIASVQKFWKFLCNILENTPDK